MAFWAVSTEVATSKAASVSRAWLPASKNYFKSCPVCQPAQKTYKKPVDGILFDSVGRNRIPVAVSPPRPTRATPITRLLDILLLPSPRCYFRIEPDLLPIRRGAIVSAPIRTGPKKSCGIITTKEVQNACQQVVTREAV